MTSAHKLVFDDGAKFVTGTWGSTPSISAAETVFEPNEILFASTGWSNKVIGPDKPFTFRLHMTGREYNGAVYAYLKDARPELKKAATLCASDDAGHSAGKAIRELAESHGFEIVAEEFQERGTTDYYSFLTRIMAKDPDILDVCGAVPGDESLMIKQFRELGGDALISAAVLSRAFSSTSPARKLSRASSSRRASTTTRRETSSPTRSGNTRRISRRSSTKKRPIRQRKPTTWPSASSRR